MVTPSRIPRDPPLISRAEALELLNTPSETLSAAARMAIVEDLLYEPEEDEAP